MSVIADQVAVDDDSPALVVEDNSDTISTPNALLRNVGSNSAYLGGDDVTDSDGFELKTTDPWLPVTLKNGDGISAICASGKTTTIAVLAIGS